MSKRTKIFLVGLTVFGAIVFVVWGMTAPSAVAPEEKNSSETQRASIVYYYGKECSHCQEVEKFLKENKISEKVDFIKKEVWHDSKNLKEMQNRASECGISEEKLGVPFIFAEGKCFVGGPDVEKFFRERAGLK